MLVHQKTSLFLWLREHAAQSTQTLIVTDFYDHAVEGPDVKKFERIAGPQVAESQRANLPHDLWWTIGHAVETGTAFQALGNLDIASVWYQIGQYGWFENKALCAALSRDASQAEQLFREIAEHESKTVLELQVKEQARDYQAISQSLGRQIFALTWLGSHWDKIGELLEMGRRAVKKSPPGGLSELNMLFEISGRLTAYFLNPSDETRAKATDSLRLNKLPDRAPYSRSHMLRYLFALGQRYPEINPYAEDVFHTRLWRPSAGKRDTPPTKEDFQNALDEMFREAYRQKKWAVEVSSVELHIRAGGYPSSNHQLELCCEVMQQNHQQYRDMLTGQGDNGRLVIYYQTLRG